MQKTKLLFLCLLILGSVNAQTLSYRTGNSGGGSSNVTAEIKGYLTTSQQNVSLDIYSDIYTGVWTGTANYDYYVNDNYVGSSTTQSQTIDLTSYIPVSSVKVVSKAYTWSTVLMNVIVTPATALTSGPGVSSTITYCKDATPEALQASLSGSGKTLKWFSSALGDGYAASAPTPSTASTGTSTYYVSQTDDAGVESERSLITVTVVDQVVISCADDKTVENPTSQNQVDAEFMSFLNGFSNNSPNSKGSFSTNTNGFEGAYASNNWTTVSLSANANLSHTASTISIGVNSGGGGVTRQIMIPAAGVISFDWSAYMSGTGGNAFNYIINGVAKSITSGNGSGSVSDIVVNAGDQFQFSTWGFTKSSAHSVSVNNFKVTTSLPSKNVTESGFVNTVAVANWTTSAQSASSYLTHTATTLTIGANAGGAGSTRKLIIPADGVIGFDWSANYTGSNGYTFNYIINGVETVITNGSGSGSLSAIAVKAGDVFEIRTWGYTQSSTYSVAITNFSYQYTEANVGAVAGFYANNGSIDVTYTVPGNCGPVSCKKTFSVIKNNTTDDRKPSSNEMVRYYPNPARATITLDLDKNAGLRIYSLEGRLMKTMQLVEGANTIQLDDLKAGYYNFRVIAEDSVKTFNIIKE